MRRAYGNAEEKGAAYTTWRATHLAGLVPCVVPPREVCEQTQWDLITVFDHTTPGATEYVGDYWSVGDWDGTRLYQRGSGGDTVVWGPPALVDSWLQEWMAQQMAMYGTVRAAIWVLRAHQKPDVAAAATRLAELHGIQHYVALGQAAAPGEIVLEAGKQQAEIAVCVQYDFPHIVVTRDEDANRIFWRIINGPPGLPTGVFYRDPAGHWYTYDVWLIRPLTVAETTTLLRVLSDEEST